MRRKLYSVAAKCFSMGGDGDKEDEALANQKIMTVRLALICDRTILQYSFY